MKYKSPSRLVLLATFPLAACTLLVMPAHAQQVMWANNPISNKVVGQTFGMNDWFASEALAVTYGGHLVTIRSQAEQNWLIATFAGTWSLVGHGPWLGFNDAATEGTWVWSSGEAPTFTYWATGEPNNTQGIEDWAYILDAGVNWRWNDGGSAFLNRSLIEVASRPPRSWSWPTAYATGSHPGYGTVFDMDGDGDLDYASPDRDASQVTVFGNDGVGNFAQSFQVAGCGSVHTTVPCDWDADGDVDLLATDRAPAGRVLLLRNDAGTWTSMLLAGVPYCHGAVVADVNLDGRDDLITTSTGTDDMLRVFLRQADGSLSAPATYGPFFDEIYQPTIQDLDGDGMPDLILAGGEIRVLRGSVSGTFTDVGSLGTGRVFRVAVADLDADGTSELLAPRVDANTLEVWHRTTTGPLAPGNFTVVQSLACGAGPHWAETGDLDGDGDLDVVIPSETSGTIHVWRNEAGVLLPDR